MKFKILFILLILILQAHGASAGVAEVKAAIQKRLDAHLIRGMAVQMINGDESNTIFMGDAQNASDLFELGSISKSAAGIIAAQLSLENKLDLNAPISKYIPELAGTFVGSVTATQLALHKAQIVSTIYNDRNQEVYNYDEETLINFLRNYRPNVADYPPNVSSYSNTGFSTLGLLISRIDKRSFPDSVRERIFRPLNMNQSTFIPTNANVPGLLPGYGVMMQRGYYFFLGIFEAASGGIISSIGDMKSYLKANLFPDQSALGQAMVKSQKLGLGWDSKPDNAQTYKGGMMSAGFSTIIKFDKAKKMGVIVLNNSTNTRMVGEVADVAMGVEDTLADQTLTNAQLNSFIGMYTLNEFAVEVYEFHERFLGFRMLKNGNTTLVGRLIVKSPNHFFLIADGGPSSPVDINGNQLVYFKNKGYDANGNIVYEKFTFVKH